MTAEQKPIREEDPYGRRAFFSASRPVGKGPLEAECSRCGGKSRMNLVEAVRRQAPFFTWIPVLRYSRLMNCPACEQRVWMKLRRS